MQDPHRADPRRTPVVPNGRDALRALARRIVDVFRRRGDDARVRRPGRVELQPDRRSRAGRRGGESGGDPGHGARLPVRRLRSREPGGAFAARPSRSPAASRRGRRARRPATHQRGGGGRAAQPCRPADRARQPPLASAARRPRNPACRAAGARSWTHPATGRPPPADRRQLRRSMQATARSSPAPTCSKTLLRRGDLAARVSGNEFVVLLPGANGEVAERVADRLLRAIGSTPQARLGEASLQIRAAAVQWGREKLSEPMPAPGPVRGGADAVAAGPPGFVDGGRRAGCGARTQPALARPRPWTVRAPARGGSPARRDAVPSATREAGAGRHRTGPSASVSSRRTASVVKIGRFRVLVSSAVRGPRSPRGPPA